MISNFHTHTHFCDGKSTPEEVVLSAIQKGFSSLGFSGHGYTDFDLSYCMQDIDGYRAEIRRLQEKYKKDIQIYLGVEEDAFCLVDRKQYDYIIGSAHYMRFGKRYFAVDGYEDLQRCLARFDRDPVALAETYYRSFCEYIHFRKPDIIGHFDLMTKFDEKHTPQFLCNEAYHRIAEQYIAEAAKSGCIFEVNTGAISRGYRTTPYPHENLLHVLKKQGARLILSADSHHKDTIDCNFAETKKYLRDMGFTQLYTLHNGAFIPYDI